MYSPMKTHLSGPHAMSRLRLCLIATCLVAITPPLFGDIILVSRLSDAEAFAAVPGGNGTGAPPPQSQTGFSPANLCNRADENNHVVGEKGSGTGTSTSNSSILINNPMQGLRVVGDGTATASVYIQGQARASAKLIVLTFTLTDPHPYSITGQLNGAGCDFPFCSKATAKLTGETGTIFERVGTPLSESGTLSPGNYTLSVDVYAAAQGITTYFSSDANFDFALDGPVSTPTPTPTPIPVTRATNLSTRLLVGTREDEFGIGGFIITGTGPRHLLIRGIGPSLSGIIANALSDPLLIMDAVINCLPQSLVNDNWRDRQEAEIIATGRAPGNDLESAVVVDLTPGAYTVRLRGNAAGVGLVEIYDLSTNQESKLANISTRGFVQTGDNVMIGGFILGGSGGSTSVAVRGIGPSLSQSGLSNVLADPTLELRDSNGALLISNDNWEDDPASAAQLTAHGLAPQNSLESGIFASLPPAAFTAILTGKNGGIGVGLVEIYNVQ
jgi:hypothetical protein